MTDSNPQARARTTIPHHAGLGSVLLLIASAFLVAGCDWQGHANDELEPYLHLVSTQPVVLEDGYTVQRQFAGRVEATQSPRVGFELGGLISELLVDEGDSAAAGALLARLDTRLLDAERIELTARAAEISADLELARRNLGRIGELESRQLASERERDEIASRVRLLEASLARNEAALDGNRIRLEQSELRAPFDVQIRTREADAGTVVDAGAPVFSLVASRLREVRAGLPARLTGTLSVGDRVSVSVGSEERVGVVLALGAVIDPITRSRAVRLAVEADWPPGEQAYLQLEEPVRQNGAWLPATALTEGLRGTWVAYVAVPAGDGEATLEKRSLVIHHARQGRLFVSGAIAAGDEVVTGGLHRVAPGQRVKTSAADQLTERTTSNVRPGA